MLFGYFQAVGAGKGRELSMAIENFQRTRNFQESSAYYTAHYGWPRKNFQNRQLEYAIF